MGVVHGGDGGGEGSTEPIKIAGNIFVSFIGAGVLGMPFAFKQAGVAEGTLTMVVVGMLAIKAMLLLIDCKYAILATRRRQRVRVMLSDNATMLRVQGDDKPLIPDSSDEDEDTLRIDISKSSVGAGRCDENLTYSDIGYHAAGAYGERLVEICIITSQLGFCCAYLIFVKENMHSYFPHIDPRVFLLLLLPVLYVLSLYRQLHRLAAFSLFAQFSNILAFTVVFWFDFEHMAHASERTYPANWSLAGFPFFFAIAIYCYEGAGMVLSLEASVAKSARHLFTRYFLIVLTCVTSLYIAFGIAGYMSFGPYTHEIITLDLPHSDGFNAAMLVKMCLCLALLLTYPVMMFPVTEMLQRKLLRAGRKPDAAQYCAENLLRLGLVAFTALVVLLIPSFADLMALIGATCCATLAFILPGFFHMRLVPSTSIVDELLDYSLIIVGVVGDDAARADENYRFEKIQRFCSAILGTADTLNNLRMRYGAASTAQMARNGSVVGS